MTAYPPGWVNAPLDEMCTINPRVDKNSIDTQSAVSFVPMTVVEAETGKIDVSETRNFGAVRKGYTPFRKGDVLFAKITPCMENGKMAVVPDLVSEYGFGSTEFHVLRPAHGIDPRFLYHAVSNRAFRFHAEHNMTGAVGQKRVPATILEKHEIGLPPANEQSRIVERIETLFDEIDQGVESLRAAKKAIGLYRQSLLKAAFEGRLTADWRAKNPDKLEDPGVLLARICEERETRHQAALAEWQQAIARWHANGEQGKKPARPKRPNAGQSASGGRLGGPTSWTTATLREIAFEAVLGKMLDRQRNRGQPRIYLGNINLRWGLFNVDSGKTIPIEDHEVPRYGVRAGDLIICEGGEPGRCAVWDGDDNQVFVQKALHRVRFTASYSPTFAYHFFRFSAAAGRLDKHYTGSTIKHLTGRALEDVLLPICSPAEQAEITRVLESRLEAAEILDAEIDTNLARAEALRQSILKKAFSGQLVPQDPTDEPAAALLQRIQAERASQRQGGTTRKREARIA